MNSDLYVDALSAPLPEDIARRQPAGRGFSDTYIFKAFPE